MKWVLVIGVVGVGAYFLFERALEGKEAARRSAIISDVHRQRYEDYMRYCAKQNRGLNVGRSIFKVATDALGYVIPPARKTDDIAYFFIPQQGAC